MCGLLSASEGGWLFWGWPPFFFSSSSFSQTVYVTGVDFVIIVPCVSSSFPFPPFQEEKEEEEEERKKEKRAERKK